MAHCRDLRGVAEALAPGRWPTTDEHGVHAVAQRLAELVARLHGIAADVVAVHDAHPIGDGAFHRAVHADGGDRRGGAEFSRDPEFGGDAERGLRAVARDLDAAVTAVHDFADATVRARERMTLVAAIADRDRLVGEVTALLGDGTRRVQAAAAGRLALVAAGEEYAEDASAAAAQFGTTHGGTIHDARPDPDTAMTGGASGGLMPMGGPAAAAGAFGVGMVAGRALASGRVADGAPPTLTRSEGEFLLRRATALQDALDAREATWVQVAVGIGTGPEGARLVVVGTSDPVPYLRIGLRLQDTEELAGDGRAPEIAVLDHLTARGMVPLAVASPQMPTTDARAMLAAAGAVSLVAHTWPTAGWPSACR